MTRAAFALVLVLALVAGCYVPTEGPSDDAGAAVAAPADWAERALPFGASHDHYDAAQHANLSTPNFRLVGHDPLTSESLGRGAGGYLCADANGNATRRLAVVHSLGNTEVAFVIADVTDPASPKMVGELLLRGTTARDIGVSADTKWVVVATELVNPGSMLPSALALPTARFRDACTGLERAIPFPAGGPYPSGMILVSLEDPAAPEVVDYYPLPVLGAHSIGIDRVDEVDIITASVTNAAQHGSYFMFFTIEGGKLAFQSVYQHRPVAANAAVENLHNDGWVRKHPITGQTLAYLADWDSGLAIVDLSDVKDPKEVGRWSDYDVTQGLDNTAAVHSAVPLETTWDGKHYTFIGQEILNHPANTPTGVVSVLDTTDPAAPTRVGAWTLPVDVEWSEQLVFSTHYLTIVERTLFISMYHGGVWAVSVEDPTAPRSVGAYVPSIEPPEGPASLAYSWTPTIMETKALDTGDVAIWDSTSGLYLVRFDPTTPAPPIEEWPLVV